MTQRPEIEHLLQKLFTGSLTVDERKLLNEHPEVAEALRQVWKDTPEECTDAEKEALILSKIRARIGKETVPTLYSGKNIMRGLCALAASVAILTGISFFFTPEAETTLEKPKEEKIALTEISANDVTEVTLIVANGKKIELENNAQVEYSATGQVQVNADQLESAAATEEYNQIIVPKGRRSMITLADNSQIWINSGSKVKYPRVFNSKQRRIVVEGEVYLKVAHNDTKPFLVSTSQFEVEVYGTSFNVTAYKDGSEATVVLLEGSVHVKDCANQSIEMQPNERVILSEAGISKKEKVNALEYIGWINGVWMLNGQPLKEVIRRLNRYYGKPVNCHPSIENEPVYGKLYLNDDPEKVLESIRQALSATPNIKKEYIYSDSLKKHNVNL